MTSFVREIICGVGASFLMFFLMAMFHIHSVLSVVLSVSFYMGLKLTLPVKKVAELIDMDQETFQASLKEARDHLQFLHKDLKSVKEIEQIQIAPLEKILQLSENIINFVDKNPKVYIQARDFMELFLPKVIELIHQFIQLSRYEQANEQQKQTLEQFKINTIPKIIERLEHDYQLCLQDDFSKLSADSEALEWLTSSLYKMSL